MPPGASCISYKTMTRRYKLCNFRKENQASNIPSKHECNVYKLEENPLDIQCDKLESIPTSYSIYRRTDMGG